VQKVVKCSN